MVDKKAHRMIRPTKGNNCNTEWGESGGSWSFVRFVSLPTLFHPQRQGKGKSMSTDTVFRHIISLNERGDSEFSWNPANPDEVSAARKHFAELRGDGMLLYRVDGKERVELKEFDEEAARIIAVPPSGGG